jgi:predicted DNA-binding ArsR family transcriptional regulator
MIVIDLGYLSYVLPNKDAIAIAEILEKAEVYEKKWIPSEEREKGMEDHTHHVYPNTRQLNMTLISNNLYNVAKLAGKPISK